MIHVLPDFFCEIYDEIDHQAFRLHCGAWLRDEGLQRISDEIERSALDGSSCEDFLERTCAPGERLQERRFATLQGLDRAFAHINPLTATSSGVPPALTALAMAVAARSRLDSGARGGALIPRVLCPYPDGQLPYDIRDAFGSVIRVPPDTWNRCALQTMPETALFNRQELHGGLRIACAPLISDPEEMAFETHERDGARFYRIRPHGLRITAERVEHVLAAMIAAEINIGVAPELTLSDDLLKAWKLAIERRSGDSGRLRWLLVGSGDVGGPRPSNVAVLIDARSGDVIARQSKIFPFNFKRETLSRWKLDKLLGEEPLDEDLQPGDLLTVLEGGGIRVAILVCEDLKHVIELAGYIRDFGVSHILAPVFGRPLKDRRWERDRANVYAEVGSTTIVSNSRVMHTVLGQDGATGLVVWPEGAVLREAPDAAQLACFTLQIDGSAECD